jgi:hypothetical protein
MPSPKLIGMILISGSVNGREVLMQVDTGKSRTCVDSDLVALDKLAKLGESYELRMVKWEPYSFSVRFGKRREVQRHQPGDYPNQSWLALVPTFSLR